MAGIMGMVELSGLSVLERILAWNDHMLLSEKGRGHTLAAKWSAHSPYVPLTWITTMHRKELHSPVRLALHLPRCLVLLKHTLPSVTFLNSLPLVECLTAHMLVENSVNFNSFLGWNWVWNGSLDHDTVKSMASGRLLWTGLSPSCLSHGSGYRIIQ